MMLLLTALLFALTAQAAPSGNLATLSQRYGCTGYATQDQQIQCVLGSLRFLCWQEDTVARIGYGLPTSDPARQSFVSCSGGTAADPFNSEQSSWAAAEVYYERGKDSLNARVSSGQLKAKGPIYREAVVSSATLVQPSTASIGEVCKAAEASQAQTQANIARNPAFPAYEATWIRALQVSAGGYGKCRTVVSNSWSSAVGVPIIIRLASLYTHHLEMCASNPGQSCAMRAER